MVIVKQRVDDLIKEDDKVIGFEPVRTRSALISPSSPKRSASFHQGRPERDARGKTTRWVAETLSCPEVIESRWHLAPAKAPLTCSWRRHQGHAG